MYLFQATGVQLSVILEVFFGILVSFIIGLAYSVPLALLLTVIFAAIIFAGFLQLRLLSISVFKGSQASDEAGKVKRSFFYFRWMCSGRVAIEQAQVLGMVH